MTVDFILRINAIYKEIPCSYSFTIYALILEIEHKIYQENVFINDIKTSTKVINTVGEYKALLQGVNYCIKNNIKNVRIESYNEFVINQLKGIRLVREKISQIYYDEILNKLPTLEYIELRTI